MNYCGKRVGLWSEDDFYTGLCMLPPDHSGDHLVEVSTPRPHTVAYDKVRKEDRVPKVVLKSHQQQAVDELGNGKILWGRTGGGKSITALAYFVERVCDGVIGDRDSVKGKACKDVIVITTAKKRDSHDWEDEAIKFGIGKERWSSWGGVVLTVDSWNNINKYKDVENAFFIFDEQRVVGSGAWTKAFIKIARAPGNEWILLSATPGDTWLDYIPVFVANGWYKNRTAFKREHVIYKPIKKYPVVDRYIGVGKLVRYRNSILVHMPDERHTVRHTHIVDVDYDEALMKRLLKDRWNVFENCPLTDVSDLFRQSRRLCNSDSSRLEAVKQLSTQHDRVIIFYNFNYELEMLRTLKDDSVMIENDVIFAEWNGQKHENIPDSDKWVYLVQYVAGAEGWNCTVTNTVIFWSLTYSFKNWHQAYGRIDRLNTPFTDLHYYVLMSKSWIDRAIWKALKGKKSFNESKVTGF